MNFNNFSIVTKENDELKSEVLKVTLTPEVVEEEELPPGAKLKKLKATLQTAMYAKRAKEREKRLNMYAEDNEWDVDGK